MNGGRGASRGVGRGGTTSDRQQAAARSTDTTTTAAGEASGSATTRTTGRGSRGSSSTASSGRFRPKAIRRDEADRDELARREAQKASERAAEERRARGRSRFRSKRSRGDVMGSRGRGISTASGPFSGGLSGASSGAGGFRSGGGTFNVGAGGGGEGSGSMGRGSKSDIKGFAAADGSHPMRETRINADKLHAMTPDEELDSDDEAMRAALSSRSQASALPMGIYRREHKDTGIVVATTAELEAAERAEDVDYKEEESLWVDGDDERPVHVQPTESGFWDEKADKMRIKKEDDDDAMDLDARSPHADEKSEDKAKTKKPRKGGAKELEDVNFEADMALLASELGATSVTESETGNKNGRLYLFQFPPFLPPLEPSSSSSSSSTTATSTATTETTTKIKTEDSSSTPKPIIFDAKSMPQGGLIGTMRVHRSGRTELDWGSNSSPTLEMSPGAPSSFVTHAVIVEESDDVPAASSSASAQQQQKQFGGHSFAMGPVMGRFLLAPSWDEEEDWIVDDTLEAD
ncbi:hypothetical protein CP532_0929 [Ophiocordyceps camponoti-leonardi (nom. inval.)]|nr:hypothetical protein CP532_0929 [Ophiocordyceps camponoti-leonardi (nom. inval.)]